MIGWNSGKKYVSNKLLKIGILTYHKSVNYGAYLQAYAMQKYVKRIVGGVAEIEIIDYHSLKAYQSYISVIKGKEMWDWKKIYQYIQFQRCVNVLHTSKNKLISDDMTKIQHFLKENEYDIIIVGSDEIWKVDGMRGFPTAYWLNFALADTYKISFAASSRNNILCLKENQKRYMSEALQQFSYIGVRDRMTEQLVDGLGQSENLFLNCDPTFLYSFKYDKQQFRQRFLCKYRITSKKKLFGIMISDENLCKIIKQKYGDKYVIISLLDELPSADYNLLGLTPFEWVKVIGILDILVTNRFHGTVFSIKSNIPFLAVDDYDEVHSSKIYDLLERCNLLNNYFPFQVAKTAQKRLEIVNRVSEILEQSISVDYSEIIKREKARAESFEKFMKQLRR